MGGITNSMAMSLSKLRELVMDEKPGVSVYLVIYINIYSYLSQDT